MKLYYFENELYPNLDYAIEAVKNYRNKFITIINYDGEAGTFADIEEEFEADKFSFLELYSSNDKKVNGHTRY